jgi:hypothetical protein
MPTPFPRAAGGAIDLAFATPRKLPRAADLRGRVVVLDVAFASEASGGGFDKLTKPLIDGLGARLAAWIDHHDHVLHAKYEGDPRFVLATKAEHGACPEMVTPELVARVGAVDTIVCHTDFDGLCSAAKWMCGGREPYEGADADARAVDTRIGAPGPVAERIDRAIRARPRDTALLGLIVRHLAGGLVDASLWGPIDQAGAELAELEAEARRVAARYVRLELSGVAGPRTAAFVDATAAHGRYDKTLLLLLGQQRAEIAAVVDRDTVTFAAPFDSGVSFLAVLGLSGGMPTLVSIPKSGFLDALRRLGAGSDDVMKLA